MAQSAIADNREAFQREGLMLRTAEGQWHFGIGPFERCGQPHGARPSFFLPDFYLREETPWLVPSQYVRSLAAWEPSPQPRPRLTWQEPSIESFETVFEEFTRLNLSGVLQKVVPVVFAEAESPLSSAQIEYFAATLARAPEGRWAYAYWNSEEAIFGITPELLFHYSENQLNTMALAGTARADQSASLLVDAKERHEHELVVTDLRQRLSELGGTLHVGETRERTFGPLKHLLTPLSLRGLADFDFANCVALLHPTPALGGAPRAEALAFLKANGVQRRRFGAPFGLNIPGEQALAVVAIRNLQWWQGRWRLGSGCGLVAASQFEREWQELALKRQSVRVLLGLE